ncbi:MAG: DUF4336 domain-containing protein [Nannocystaceae bacterium]
MTSPLVDHGDGIYSASATMRFPGFRLPIRMAAVALERGGLWLHSPIAADAALLDAVAAKGDVRFVVAPNQLHHLFVQPWLERFAGAQLWGAAGLEHKRSELTFTGFHGTAQDPWHDEIESIRIDGAPKLAETVFFHRRSRTLIVTDLVFNLRTAEGWLAPLLLRMMGVHGKLAQSRAWRFGVKDRAAAAASARRVLAMSPRRLVVAHGDVIEALPEGALERALEWMLAGGKALPAAA